jgi:hypothetical protein
VSAPSASKLAGLRRIGPWVVTVGLLYLMFRHISLADVIAAVHRAAPWTIPAAVLGIAAIYFADSLAIWKTFGWFLAPLTFGQVLVVRGATYLLAAINYNVGQGAMVYFIHRAKGTTIMRGVATLLLVLGINVLALIFLSTVGLGIAPDVPRVVRIVIFVAYGGLAVYLLALAFKPRWLVERPLFDVLLGAGLGGHLKALAVRLPHIAVLLAFQIAVLYGFGVRVPIAQAVVTLPLVFFIAVLPISVQGLGTNQAVMTFFFARYAPGDAAAQSATVIAASLFATAVGTTLQAALGLACLRTRTGQELRAAAAASVAAKPAVNPGPAGG